MNMEDLKKALDIRRPWSWFIGGIFFGIAELIYGFYYVFDPNSRVYHYITVTTQLAGMFAVMERLFGYSIVGRALKLDVHWYIWSLILFTAILAMIEKDYRGWVKYNWKYLAFSFFGGAVFSYGTRLAAGCTLNHMFGGFPTMTMASTFVMLGIIIGALPTFYLVSKIFGPYIKAWEYGESFPRYRQTCIKLNLKQELKTYDPNYRWYKNWFFLLSGAFIIFMAVYTLYMGFVSKYDPVTGYFKHGLDHKGWGYFWASIAAAAFTALGAFKPGTGSVCGEIAPEAYTIIGKQHLQLAKDKLPGSTMIMFRSLQPFIGVVTAMIITGIGGWISVFIFGVPITYKEGLYLPHLGHIIGGILLGVGAVMILGCEFRTYVRIGAGFLNSMAAFLGFYFGYWPYALAADAHKEFFAKTTFIKGHYFWFEYVPSKTGQAIVYILWLLMLVGFLIWAIKAGSKALGVSVSDILLKPSIELFTDLVEKPTEEVKEIVEEVIEEGQKL